MMVLRGGVFKRCFSDDDGDLIQSLIKEAPARFQSPSTMRGHSKKVPAVNLEEGPHSVMLAS